MMTMNDGDECWALLTRATTAAAAAVTRERSLTTRRPTGITWHSGSKVMMSSGGSAVPKIGSRCCSVAQQICS